eukprot:GILK01002644.1.p1 GENE.GILK01002644.1~~GILK01002644.1.p1  ORF type:complete len:354 (-),score=53.45 GILK01002644.1:175-1194(-)
MANYCPPVDHCLHSGYGHDVLRAWQGETYIDPASLIYPIFILDDPDVKEEIKSMPGVFRWGYNRVADECIQPLYAKGLKAVMIFGVVANDKKDATAQSADSADSGKWTSPVPLVLEILRARFPNLLLLTDLCLCAYTEHGHCGILHADGSLDNQKSIDRLAAVALSFVKAGAHVIAPSDMMDGRIGAIKHLLRQHGFDNIPVMSYSSKFASCFYGPFRDAAGSAPAFGDRRNYQLPPAGRGLALRASLRDVEEGADYVMVKPAGPYMDIIRDVKNAVHVPVACYQVSGEFAMIYHAAANGAFDLKKAVLESFVSLRRAGADIIITYFVPQYLDWLTESK